MCVCSEEVRKGVFDRSHQPPSSCTSVKCLAFRTRRHVGLGGLFRPHRRIGLKGREGGDRFSRPVTTFFRRIRTFSRPTSPMGYSSTAKNMKNRGVTACKRHISLLSHSSAASGRAERVTHTPASPVRVHPGGFAADVDTSHILKPPQIRSDDLARGKGSEAGRRRASKGRHIVFYSLDK